MVHCVLETVNIWNNINWCDHSTLPEDKTDINILLYAVAFCRLFYQLIELAEDYHSRRVNSKLV